MEKMETVESDNEDVVYSIEEGESPLSSDFEIDGGDTYSVQSSVLAYRMENGRRYHAYKDGAYWAPNDDTQNEVLDIDHNKFLKLLDGKLYLAPLKKDIEKVLDIGTGTGIWAIDFADEFPRTAVLGIDLSPIQPSLVPPNCRFEVDDVQDEWIYPANYFDFIHIRSMFGSIMDWPALYKQAYNHLKPGQWFEQLEPCPIFKTENGIRPPNCPMTKLAELFREAGDLTGQKFNVADSMRKDIEEAGFVNVVEKVFKMPMAPWASDPKLNEVGRWTLLGLDLGLEGYSMATLTRVLGWTPTEVRVLAAQVRSAVKDLTIHSYADVRVVYAQKPV